MSSQVRERAPRVEVRSITRSARPFGLSPKEIVVAALALLFFVVVIVYYFTSLRPEQARLRQLEQRLAEQDALVKDAPAPADTATPVNTGKDALSSLETFITGRLRPLSPGRIALQNELNALIKKNGLQLTSSIETHVDTIKGQGDQASGRRMKLEDMFNVFPRQSIHFVVFGQYPNLRAFLSDLEHNKQFLVIKSVNFTTQEDTGEGGRRQRAAASGIMLSVDLTAYFQP
jgi:hypothetical protein